MTSQYFLCILLLSDLKLWIRKVSSISENHYDHLKWCHDSSQQKTHFHFSNYISHYLSAFMLVFHIRIFA